MADSLATALAVTALGQTVATFPVFLPSLSDVRKGDVSDPTLRGDVRLGEVAASAVAISVGLVMSNLAGSSLPLMTATIMSAVVVGIYEYSLTRTRPMEGTLTREPVQ